MGVLIRSWQYRAPGQPTLLPSLKRAVKIPALPLFAAWLMAAAAFAATAAAPVPATEREVAHLLSHLSGSGCEFYRNGDWHAAEAARAHLEKKYRYLRDKGLVKTTEDFIQRGASESSMSHEPYQVRCAGRVSASASWLRAELSRYRAAAPQ